MRAPAARLHLHGSRAVCVTCYDGRCARISHGMHTAATCVVHWLQQPMRLQHTGTPPTRSKPWRKRSASSARARLEQNVCRVDVAVAAPLAVHVAHAGRDALQHPYQSVPPPRERAAREDARVDGLPQVAPVAVLLRMRMRATDKRLRANHRGLGHARGHSGFSRM
jgi:hypothetical protein